MAEVLRGFPQSVYDSSTSYSLWFLGCVWCEYYRLWYVIL